RRCHVLLGRLHFADADHRRGLVARLDLVDERGGHAEHTHCGRDDRNLAPAEHAAHFRHTNLTHGCTSLRGGLASAPKTARRRMPTMFRVMFGNWPPATATPGPVSCQRSV